MEQRYKVIFSKQALKDSEKLKQAGLTETTKKLIEILKINPYQNPPYYEKLIGDLKGHYSRRINYQHRITYKVDNEEKVVKVRRMWTHYE
ncbi:MAG: Txe/YoeB family addiction module toxin [Candidatus Nanoarchaeia archaeon]|nr:Txe/YoeB family addiction module toxin [Candidatus Nanoarchaeia archaeon]